MKHRSWNRRLDRTKICVDKIRLAGMVLLLAVPALQAAQAAQLVLFSFDHHGHSIERVVVSGAVQSFRKKAPTQFSAEQLPDSERSMNALEAGKVGLIWLDRNGYQIQYNITDDPRVSHSPEHINGDVSSVAVITKGAWLAKAPDQAVNLILLLAPHPVVFLPGEVWELALPPSRRG